MKALRHKIDELRTHCRGIGRFVPILATIFVPLGLFWTSRHHLWCLKYESYMVNGYEVVRCLAWMNLYMA